MYLIDIPTPFDTASRWKQFLAEMRSLPQDDPQVCAAIEAAEKALEGLGSEP